MKSPCCKTCGGRSSIATNSSCNTNFLSEKGSEPLRPGQCCQLNDSLQRVRPLLGHRRQVIFDEPHCFAYPSRDDSAALPQAPGRFGGDGIHCLLVWPCHRCSCGSTATNAQI